MIIDCGVSYAREETVSPRCIVVPIIPRGTPVYNVLLPRLGVFFYNYYWR